MEEKEVNLGYLKEDKESVLALENIVNGVWNWVFNIFVEDPKDVEFRGVEDDILVWVYIKGRFIRYITVEDWKHLTDYYSITQSDSVVAEIQPKDINNNVVVLKVKRNDE